MVVNGRVDNCMEDFLLAEEKFLYYVSENIVLMLPNGGAFNAIFPELYRGDFRARSFGTIPE